MRINKENSSHSAESKNTPRGSTRVGAERRTLNEHSAGAPRVGSTNRVRRMLYNGKKKPVQKETCNAQQESKERIPPAQAVEQRTTPRPGTATSPKPSFRFNQQKREKDQPKHRHGPDGKQARHRRGRPRKHHAHGTKNTPTVPSGRSPTPSALEKGVVHHDCTKQSQRASLH